MLITISMITISMIIISMITISMITISLTYHNLTSISMITISLTNISKFEFGYNFFHSRKHLCIICKLQLSVRNTILEVLM